MEKFINKNNDEFQLIEVLKYNRNKRHKRREFFIEGVQNINEAVRNNWEFVSLIYPDRRLSDWADRLVQNVKTQVNYRITNELMAKLSGKDNPSELLAIIKMNGIERVTSSVYPSAHPPLIVLFDRPSNKGNLGTVIRSCDAFGADILLVTGHAVDIYDPSVIAASMGSFFHMPVIWIEYPETYFSDMKNKHPNLKIVGASSHAELSISDTDLTVPLILLIGNETDGLSKNLLQMSDTLVRIPMNANSAATSFNAACAATVVMYEVIRQKGSGI